MSAILNTLVSRLRAFHQGSSTGSLLQEIAELTSRITAADLRIRIPPVDRGTGAPVTYVEVHDDPLYNYNMSVFILNNATAELPLHDHPQMHGVVKVLAGEVELDQYTPVPGCPGCPTTTNGLFARFSEKAPLCATLISSKILNSQCPPSCLTPHEANIHRIKAHRGPAAFFDVLTPRYDPPRIDCHYYVITSASCKSNSDHVVLREVPCPRTFYNDIQVYEGPRPSPIQL